MASRPIRGLYLVQLDIMKDYLYYPEAMLQQLGDLRRDWGISHQYCAPDRH